jgi:hypothetical protein
MAASIRRSAALAGLVAGAALLLGADKSSGPSARRKATPAPTAAAAGNGCKTCVEKRPVLDGALFADKTIYEPEAPAGYRIAREIPATIDRLHCFCECAENPGLRHKTLLTCFTDRHAAGCGICVREALLAKELKDKGASDEEIATLVESMFRTEGHPPTHAGHAGR